MNGANAVREIERELCAYRACWALDLQAPRDLDSV